MGLLLIKLIYFNIEKHKYSEMLQKCAIKMPGYYYYYYYTDNKPTYYKAKHTAYMYLREAAYNCY